MKELPFDPDVLDDAPRRPRGSESALGEPRLPSWRVMTAVALGGGLGSLARYGVSQATQPDPSTFPWDTFIVNVVGCLLIGSLMVVVTERPRVSWWWRPPLGVGFLGGLTTYSTMMLELRDLASARDLALACGYAVGSLLAGLVAVWLGITATRHVGRRSGGGATADERG